MLRDCVFCLCMSSQIEGLVDLLSSSPPFDSFAFGRGQTVSIICTWIAFLLGLCGAIFKTICFVCFCFFVFLERAAFSPHPSLPLCPILWRNPQNHCMFSGMKSQRFVVGGLFSSTVAKCLGPRAASLTGQQFDCFLCSSTQSFLTINRALNLVCHRALLISFEALILKSVTA